MTVRAWDPKPYITNVVGGMCMCACVCVCTCVGGCACVCVCEKVCVCGGVLHGAWCACVGLRLVCGA